MIQAIRIDKEGFFVEDVILNDNMFLERDIILELCPCGFYKPKWYENRWIEGLSQEEIEGLKPKSTEKSKAELEIAQEQLFNTQSELLQIQIDKDKLVNQLFELQTILLEKGVL